MESTREILSLIYNRFYLRDFFGKIVPGLVFCTSIYLTLKDLEIVPPVELKPLLIIVLIGISWILGFCMQSFGEWIKLIRYYPSSYENQSDFLEDYINFQSQATEHEKEDVERLVVIKEACGNLCSTFLLSCICLHLIFLNACGFTILQHFIRSFWSLYVVGLLVFCFLFRMHRIHVKRQDDFMRTAINRKKGNA